MDIGDLVIDFYNGIQTLQAVGGLVQIAADRKATLERLAAFERAYDQLAELHAQGKIDAGAVDFSAENREFVRRIRGLLRPDPASDEAPGAADELRTLIEQCLRGLMRDGAKVAVR